MKRVYNNGKESKFVRIYGDDTERAILRELLRKALVINQQRGGKRLRKIELLASLLCKFNEK